MCVHWALIKSGEGLFHAFSCFSANSKVAYLYLWGFFLKSADCWLKKKDATSSTDRLFLNLTRIHKRIKTPYSFCSLLNSYWSMYIPVEILTVYFFLINAFRLHGLLKNYTFEVNICKLYIQYILFLFCKGFMIKRCGAASCAATRLLRLS